MSDSIHIDNLNIRGPDLPGLRDGESLVRNVADELGRTLADGTRAAIDRVHLRIPEHEFRADPNLAIARALRDRIDQGEP
jgi:hypothetical protein